jgi:hypothetical protein
MQKEIVRLLSLVGFPKIELIFKGKLWVKTLLFLISINFSKDKIPNGVKERE